MKFINKLMSLPQWLKITISVVLILLVTWISFLSNINKFEEITKKSLSHIDEAYCESIQLTKADASDSLTKVQVGVLLKKTSIIERNKDHHLVIIRTLSKHKYSLYTLFPLMSAITAIFVLLILQKGWNSSNVYTKSYFILFTTLTSLIGLYPDVYKTTEGIEEHTKSYLDYDGLQKTIFGYSLTAPIVEGDTIAFGEFIDRVNTQERDFASLRFNIEKMSLDKEMFNSIEGSE